MKDDLLDVIKRAITRHRVGCLLERAHSLDELRGADQGWSLLDVLPSTATRVEDALCTSCESFSEDMQGGLCAHCFEVFEFNLKNRDLVVSDYFTLHRGTGHRHRQIDPDVLGGSDSDAVFRHRGSTKKASGDHEGVAEELRVRGRMAKKEWEKELDKYRVGPTKTSTLRRSSRGGYVVTGVDYVYRRSNLSERGRLRKGDESHQYSDAAASERQGA